MIGSSLEEYAAARQALDDACERAERDPKTLGMSIMSGFLLGSNEHELLNHARDARALGLGRRSAATVERFRRRGLAGTPDELLEGFGRLAEVGVERVALQHIVHEDVDTVALLGEVAGRA